jgi:glyoxylase-like metal-dependent hydrolase (beta-lactamase superfamily II)
MQIGKYKLHAIQTGLIRLDGGAMFGVVPKPLWSKTNPADERNRIDMCMRALLLVSDEKKILIDNGAGNEMGDKLNDIYGIDYTKYSLDKSLNKAGLKTADITDVILTHLHFDHCGGSTYYDDNKELKLTFPNATYHLQKKHWDWANNPTERDKASFFKDDFIPIQKAGQLNIIDSEILFDEQIKLHIINGHTISQQMVSISDGTKTLLYPADLLPLTTHVNIPYIMGYDLFPLTTLEEKKKYLPKIAEEKWYVFFEHDPFTEISKIHWNQKRFEIVDKTRLEVL